MTIQETKHTQCTNKNWPNFLAAYLSDSDESRESSIHSLPSHAIARPSDALAHDNSLLLRWNFWIWKFNSEARRRRHWRLTLFEWICTLQVTWQSLAYGRTWLSGKLACARRAEGKRHSPTQEKRWQLLPGCGGGSWAVRTIGSTQWVWPSKHV